jgi:hypothetical protein
MERVWRYMCSPGWSELELHSEAVSERVGRCIWRQTLSELSDTLGGHDRVSLKMHLEAKIDRTQNCTLRLSSREIGVVLGGGRFGERRDGSRDTIHWLTYNCGDVES